MTPAHLDRLSDDAPLPVPSGTTVGPEVLAHLPHDVAFAAWQVLRSVSLWTAEPEPRRGRMFGAEFMEEWERTLLSATFDPEARFPLAVIVRELAGPDPAGGRLSWACVCMADWLLGRGERRAALAYAEAGALAASDNPRYAWLVGRLMRAHGDGRGGERWLKRALSLAMTHRDHETQARALTSLGNLYVETGRYPEARDHHERALRISRKWRLREHEGMALHDLFVVATEEGNRAEAERLAAEGLDVYRTAPARYARLAHDVAYWWIGFGYYARAMQVIRAVRPHLPGVEDQMKATANIARAAGGCGDDAAFEAALAEFAELRTRSTTGSALPTSLVELAYGAVSLGAWKRARELAAEALQAAEGRNEATVLTRATELLEKFTHTPTPLGILAERRPPSSGADRLAASIVASLESEAAAPVG